jgi:DNA-binding HxlR family transcriptional regulator
MNIDKANWNPENCPIRTVLNRFGDKWSILVLIILGEKHKLRFSEINKEIGPDISQKMLTVTLRTLEADGLISRTIYPEVPPRVEYEITDLGKTLIPHINNLAAWAEENMSVIKDSRARFAK